MSGLLFDDLDESPANRFSFRPYQITASDRIVSSLAASAGCLAVLPCGTGKTEIIVRLVLLLAPAPSRALVIAPLQSLVGQTANRLRLRGVSCGIEQGAMRSSERVTVASYKSLISQNRYANFLDNLSVVIVDESHLNYSKRAIEILAAYREAGAKIIGLTASPERMTGDPLVTFYGDIAYFYSLRNAIDDGWLVPPKVWLTVAGDLDLSKFDEGDGDFNANRLCKEMAREANVQTVANLILQHHEGEPSVVFCQGVLQAEKVREVLANRGGLETAIVHSRMEDVERDRHMALFESGELNAILNVGCLTTGWDSPIVRKVFCCKPTRSRTLYQQMIGRGTRPLPGVIDGLHTPEARRAAIRASEKPLFEIFDLVDASRHNDLVTAVEALYPQIEDGLARRVRAKRPQSAQTLTALGELLAQERALIEEESRQESQKAAAREALTERQRAAWLAGVEFTTCERDAFLPAEQRPKERGWRVTFGRYKGRLLREVEIGWLHWALQKAHLQPAFRAAVQREVKRRAAG